MDKDFAEKLVSRYKTALQEFYAQGMNNLDEINRAEDDLLQALRVPKRVEEDFTTVHDEYVMAALKGLLSQPDERRMMTDSDKSFAVQIVEMRKADVDCAFDYADIAMAERARRQGGDHA